MGGEKIRLTTQTLTLNTLELIAKYHPDKTLILDGPFSNEQWKMIDFATEDGWQVNGKNVTINPEINVTIDDLFNVSKSISLKVPTRLLVSGRFKLKFPQLFSPELDQHQALKSLNISEEKVKFFSKTIFKALSSLNQPPQEKDQHFSYLPILKQIITTQDENPDQDLFELSKQIFIENKATISLLMQLQTDPQPFIINLDLPVEYDISKLSYTIPKELAIYLNDKTPKSSESDIAALTNETTREWFNRLLIGETQNNYCKSIEMSIQDPRTQIVMIESKTESGQDAAGYGIGKSTRAKRVISEIIKTHTPSPVFTTTHDEKIETISNENSPSALLFGNHAMATGIMLCTFGSTAILTASTIESIENGNTEGGTLYQWPFLILSLALSLITTGISYLTAKSEAIQVKQLEIKPKLLSFPSLASLRDAIAENPTEIGGLLTSGIPVHIENYVKEDDVDLLENICSGTLKIGDALFIDTNKWKLIFTSNETHNFSSYSQIQTIKIPTYQVISRDEIPIIRLKVQSLLGNKLLDQAAFHFLLSKLIQTPDSFIEQPKEYKINFNRHIVKLLESLAKKPVQEISKDVLETEWNELITPYLNVLNVLDPSSTKTPFRASTML